MQSNLATVLCHELYMYSSQESLQLQCNLLLKDSMSQNTTYAKLPKFTHMCTNYRFESFTVQNLKSTVFCDGIPCSNRIARNVEPPPYWRTGNHLPGPLFHSHDVEGTLLQMSVISHQTNVPITEDSNCQHNSKLINRLCYSLQQTMFSSYPVCSVHVVC